MLRTFQHVKRKVAAPRQPDDGQTLARQGSDAGMRRNHAMKMHAKPLLVVTVGALALGACSHMPDRVATAPALPAAWTDVETQANTAALTDWWAGFNDPALDKLVAEGLASGPSVRVAALRVKEARALSRQTIGDFLPSINGQAGANYTRVIDGPELTGSFQSFVTGGGGAVVRESEQFIGSYGPAMSWEIPLFGRIEASAIGSRANTRVAVEDLRGVRAALAGDVAQAYVDFRAGQQRVAALQEAAEISDQLARIVQIGADAGFTAPADAADARRLAESTRARVPDVVLSARRAAARLAVLRGRAPGTEPEEIAAALNTMAPVPSYALSAAPAAPADLLRLRPDIAQAQARTLVAAATLGIARADLLPQIRLTGSIDITDNIIGSAVPERLAQGSLSPGITMPLFDWGRRWSATKVRDAQFEQSLVNYQSTVNNAVSEATLALAALSEGQKRLTAARNAETASEATARGVRASFGAGIASLSDRLRAEQQLIDARVSRIGAEESQATAAIQVYRAFGGGPPPLSHAQERPIAASR
jgi:outer membrane protein, multidrug efflux system